MFENVVARDTAAPSALEVGGKLLENPTRVIAVTSGKGGVGKTNFVVNVGLALAMAGKKVMILDADLGLANVDVILGINPRYHLHHVLARQKKLEEIVVEGPCRVRVIPSGSGLSELADLPMEGRTWFLGEVMALKDTTDILLIDTAAGISQAVTQFVRAADEAIIITTPEPTAITDAYALIKVLSLQAVPSALRLVVNLATRRQEAEDTAEKLIKVVREFLGVELEELGYLPHDPCLPQAVRMQKPVLLAYPHSPLSSRFCDLSQSLVGEGSSRWPKGGLGSFFKRMAQVE